MGSRSRINTTRYFFLAGVLVILLTIFADTFLFKELKHACSDTKYMIAGIAAGQESGDALFQWLKEPPDDAFLQNGAEHMADYGYNAPTDTIWDQKYLAAKNRVLFVSVLFDFLLLLTLSCLAALCQKYDASRISSLGNALCKLQTTDTDDLDFSDFALDGVLKDRIFSLQQQLQTDRLNMQREKESTKTLVTDITHQLKTPVAALKTSLELLSGEDMTDAERQEFLSGCMHQLDCLDNLTASLVGVSRMEKGMIQLHVTASPIQPTILSAVSRLYEKAADKQISIEMAENSCSETVPVLHDPKWTAEVFVNLLDNAIKYSGAHSDILIRADEMAGFLRVSVEDHGIGIPKEEWHKIFKRFYRGKAVREMEGSGVGLYLAREIMEKQRGTIFVRSKTGRHHGSVFSVQLPKA